jgi:hypothetical protein
VAVEWYGVTPAQIVGHAGRLRGIADDIREALTEVESVSVPGGVYGETGAQFERILDGMHAEGIHTLIAAIVALESSAKGLTDNATGYDSREDAARRRMLQQGRPQ